MNIEFIKANGKCSFHGKLKVAKHINIKVDGEYLDGFIDDNDGQKYIFNSMLDDLDSDLLIAIAEKLDELNK